MTVHSDAYNLERIAQQIGGEAVAKTITFAGGTENAIGDYDGTGNPVPLFKVTGTVAIRIFGKCRTDLTGASATVTVGTAISSNALIASTTAENLDAGEIWHDNSPDASVEAISVLSERMVSENIRLTVGTANVTAGVVEVVCIWRPLSPGSSVEAA